MRPEQKRAWFIVGVFAAALTGFLVLTPLVGARPAFAAFGVFGFGGFASLLFRRQRDSEEVSMDERDRLIAERATLAGGMLSYLVFVLACMIPWFVRMFGRDQTVSIGDLRISIHVLPLIVLCGGITFFVVRAIAILVGYSIRGARNGED